MAFSLAAAAAAAPLGSGGGAKDGRGREGDQGRGGRGTWSSHVPLGPPLLLGRFTSITGYSQGEEIVSHVMHFQLMPTH